MSNRDLHSSRWTRGGKPPRCPRPRAMPKRQTVDVQQRQQQKFEQKQQQQLLLDTTRKESDFDLHRALVEQKHFNPFRSASQSHVVMSKRKYTYVFGGHHKQLAKTTEPPTKLNHHDLVAQTTRELLESMRRKEARALDRSRHARSSEDDFVQILHEIGEACFAPVKEFWSNLFPTAKPTHDAHGCPYALALQEELDKALKEFSIIPPDCYFEAPTGNRGTLRWLFRLQAFDVPPMPLVQFHLDTSVVEWFRETVRCFWDLWTPRSLWVTKTLKNNLYQEFYLIVKEMMEDVKTFRTYPLFIPASEPLAKRRRRVIDPLDVSVWFHSTYARAAERLSGLIGVLQVFKYTQEPIGSLESRMGVLYEYSDHSEEQNHRMNFVMLRWLFENWSNPTLTEETIMRLAVDAELNVIGVRQWMKHAMRGTWESYHQVIPPHNLINERRQTCGHGDSL